MLPVSACSAHQLRHRRASLASLAVSSRPMVRAFLAARTAQPAAAPVLTSAPPVQLDTICRMALASIARFATGTARLVPIPTMWSAVWSVFLVQFW